MTAAIEFENVQKELRRQSGIGELQPCGGERRIAPDGRRLFRLRKNHIAEDDKRAHKADGGRYPDRWGRHPRQRHDTASAQHRVRHTGKHTVSAYVGRAKHRLRSQPFK